jgi:hypothetical protein
MPQTVVVDLVEAPGQDVLEESPQEHATGSVTASVIR